MPDDSVETVLLLRELVELQKQTLEVAKADAERASRTAKILCRYIVFVVVCILTVCAFEYRFSQRISAHYLGTAQTTIRQAPRAPTRRSKISLHQAIETAPWSSQCPWCV
jgi:t-SNARE complex subunit (syntaxin)